MLVVLPLSCCKMCTTSIPALRGFKTILGGDFLYINTRTKKEMEKTICKYFNWKLDYLNIFLDNVYTEFKCFEILKDYERSEYTIIKALLDEIEITERIDSVLFFHLSRRLHKEDKEDDINNIEKLLTTENEFSKFLLTHEIKVIKENCQLKLFFNNKEVSLKENDNCNIEEDRLRLKIKRRLNFDFCVNGFMFKKLSTDNFYLSNLSKAPEFIVRLEEFLKYEGLVEDYMKNSCYMYYEYRIPIERILLDNAENLSSKEKEEEIIINILTRLYQYKFNENISDPILRLKDNDNIQKEFFINKEEINIQEIIGGI